MLKSKIVALLCLPFACYGPDWKLWKNQANGDDAGTAHAPGSTGETLTTVAPTTTTVAPTTMTTGDASTVSATEVSTTGTTDALTGGSMGGATEGSTEGSTAEGSSGGQSTDGEPWCGNGVVEPGEECDDGDTVHQNSCSNECHDNTNTGCTPELPDVLCDPGLYCVAPGVCGGCTALVEGGGSCSAVDAEQPACDPNSETCVECTPEDESACEENLPHCNKYTLECDRCIEHEQCDSGVCMFNYPQDEYEGICMDPSRVAWVMQQGDCAGKDGSESKPFCTIAEALAAPAWAGGPIGIMVKEGSKPQPAMPAVVGRAVAVVGIMKPDQTYPRMSAPLHSGPLVEVTSGHTLLSRLRLDESPNVSAAVECTGGNIILSQVEVAHNGGSLDFSDCEFAILRSLVTGNKQGCKFSCAECSWNYVSNSFFTENDAGAGASLLVLGNQRFEVASTTIAGNQGALSSTIACDKNEDHLVRFTSSIIVGKAQEPDACTDLIVWDSLTDPFDAVKDEIFASLDGGVYRAVQDSPLIKGLGSGWLYTDYDGQPRSKEYGEDYAGADRP